MRKENPMQVCSLPGKVIRSAGFASRCLGAKTADIEAARRRDAVLRWVRARADGLTARQAARAVGVSRATLYRWAARPEPRSRRPERVRQRCWDRRLVAEVRRLRQDNPLWSKRKLGPILRAQGWPVSDSTVGRMLADLRARGRIAPVAAFTRRAKGRGRPRRPHARRLRKALVARAPGDVVQIDSLKVSLGYGRQARQFTAIDCASRWSLAMASHRLTAASAARFLDRLLAAMPFPVRAIQIDGGSEFMAEFEAACAARAIPLWVLPPKSPEMNGRVERMQATWRYEFYATYDPPHQVAELNELLDAYAHRYNTYRPHDALGQITPLQYLCSRDSADPIANACASQMS
jgi:transposase InsO family protein